MNNTASHDRDTHVQLSHDIKFKKYKQTGVYVCELVSFSFGQPKFIHNASFETGV